MAKPEFLATPARTGFVRPANRVLGGGARHHIGRRSAVLQQLGHGLHRGAGVSKEQIQTCTEVVLARIAVVRKREPVFGTAPITKVPDFATLALRR